MAEAPQAPAAVEKASIFRVVIDGSPESGKTALRQAIFGSEFKEDKISPHISQFTSTFARIVVYEIQAKETAATRLKPLTDLMKADNNNIDVYWYLYDASSPVVFTTDLLEGAHDPTYLHAQVILSKSDALSLAQLSNLRRSIEDKLKNAEWITGKEAYPVITQRKLLFDADCPKCGSKNVFVNHKQLRWMCSECNQNGSFPATHNVDKLVTYTASSLREDMRPYFVGAQQFDPELKKTTALSLISSAAEQGHMVSGVAAVERITKELWVDLGVLWPTPAGIASKLLRLLSHSLWLSSFSERISWVISELVMRSKNPWTIACSGMLVARLLWMAIGVEYKLHTDSFMVEQANSLRDLIIKAADGPTDLSCNLHYIRLHAIIDEQYMNIWQTLCKREGYEQASEFAWSWKNVEFTLNRSGDAVLGDLLKGRHLPRLPTTVSLAPIYLQESAPALPSVDGVVPVPYCPAPIPIARVPVRK